MQETERARQEIRGAVETLNSVRHRLRRVVTDLREAARREPPVFDADGHRYTVAEWAAGSVEYIIGEPLAETMRQCRQEIMGDHAAAVAAELHRVQENADRRRAAQLAAELRPCVDDLAGVRDRALLMLTFAASLTPAEVATLGPGDVRINEETHTVTVYVKRHGRREPKRVTYEDAVEASLAVALYLWVAVAKLGPDGPVFRVVSHGKAWGKMTPRAVAAVVSRHMVAATNTAAEPPGAAAKPPAGVIPLDVAFTALRAARERSRAEPGDPLAGAVAPLVRPMAEEIMAAVLRVQ